MKKTVTYNIRQEMEKKGKIQYCSVDYELED